MGEQGGAAVEYADRAVGQCRGAAQLSYVFFFFLSSIASFSFSFCKQISSGIRDLHLVCIPSLNYSSLSL